MSFDVPTIMIMIIASIIGLAYFRFGKKQADVSFIAAGVSLMVYGYVVDGLMWTIIVGVLIGAAPFAYRRLG